MRTAISTIGAMDIPHLSVLLFTLALFLAFFAMRIRPNTDADRWIRFLLFQLLTAAGLAGLMLPWQAGYLVIPLTLCDLALFAGIWALWIPRARWAAQLLYYWGLGGGLQAILTPDLSAHFPHPMWLQFHAHHTGLILSAGYLASSGRIRPSWRSAMIVWTITNGYAAIAGLVNFAFGTNFGYLSRKPSHPSLLDFLGPWPWYLLAMEAIGTLMILLLTALLIGGKRR